MTHFAKAFCILNVLIAMMACGRRSEISTGKAIIYPFTVDVSENYPIEPMSLQEVFGEMEYVALETTPDCLVGRPDNPMVTDDDIFILSDRKSLFRFGRDGKFRNRIGTLGRGPGEYLSATRMCVNDRVKEVFIYDVLGDAIQVYGYDGQYKRTLKAEGTTIVQDMTAITDSTLLIANSTSDPTKEWGITPFQLISSRNGHIVKSLLPPYEEARPFIQTDMPQPVSGMYSRVGFPESDPSKAYNAAGMQISLMKGDQYGVLEERNAIYATYEGAMITRFVSDTVYLVTGGGELIPRWVKIPSPMKEDVPVRRYSKFDFETEQYAFFSAVGRGDPAGYRVDKLTGTITRTYFYDDNIVNLDIQYAPFNKLIFLTGVNTGRFAMIYQALNLTTILEMEKLSGELATIASTIKEDDNPVLMIAK